MKKILIINAHQPYPFSEGKLNLSLIQKMETFFKNKNMTVEHTSIMKPASAEEEVAKHVQADAIILQAPVNWMGLPWMAKKYIDEVYMAGMFGQLCQGDGRTEQAPKKNYGGAGLLTNKKYMLSLTFNAPAESFNDKNEYLFQGKSVDDLFFPQHMNFRFFGMTALETFVCHDVLKNPTIENDFKRLEAHLEKNFKAL